tara:strand:- start:191 stop:694 length:504 start_codon:yes stop_codon:yes gene_type:complete
MATVIATPTTVSIGVHSYCTMEDVRLLNPHRNYGTGSKPTEIQINRLLIQQFERMNGILDVLGYETPVPSNVTGIHVLSRLNSVYVAAQADKGQLSVGNQPQNHSDTLMEEYKLEWADFIKGKVTIKGATRKGIYVPNEDETRTKHQFNLDSSGNETDPKFTMDSKF